MNEFDENIKAAQRKNTTLLIVLGAVTGTLLLLYFFWLILAKGYVVEVVPEEAVASKFLVVTEGPGLVLGDRVYSFGKEVKFDVGAFKFETQSVFVTDDSPGVIEVVLKPSPGQLQATAIPSQEQLNWFINQQLVHIGSELEHSLDKGLHQLKVEHKFFHGVERQVEIHSLEKTVAEIELKPILGEISIDSKPVGARVFLGGKEIGSTPLKLTKEAGVYEFRLEKQGYEVLTDSIELNNAVTHPQRNYLLAPEKAVLDIQTVPATGVLLINGKQVQPGENLVDANISHSILYQKAGYFPFRQKLKLSPGQTLSLPIELKPEIGKVVIKASPDAAIYIDGTFVANGSYSKNLPAIPHKVSIKKQGYRTVNKSLTPSAQRLAKLDVKLLTEFEARRAEGRPLYVSTIGMDLARFKMTAFTMGSAANEKGRRRNEHQLPVSFNRAVWVSRHEVTEAQYSQYKPSHAKTSLPVTNISWNDAALYCNWLSEKEGLPAFYRVVNGVVAGINKGAKGYRLPSEAEWEWLARASKRAQPTAYIWGNAERIPANAGNFGDQSLKGQQTFVLKKYNDGFAGKAPVGSFRADRLGLFDIAGNVSEWVNDFYTNLPPTKAIDSSNYMGALRGNSHVWKGGNYKTGRFSELRGAYRDFSEQASDTLGFRIARYD